MSGEDKALFIATALLLGFFIMVACIKTWAENKGKAGL